MTAAEILKESETLKAEAVQLVNTLILRLPENITSPGAERLVECIISASILSITAAQAQAMEELRAKQ